eukprot:TRINITY_DN10810_c0_g1_i1.p1 TRINITY_DN10810_c0_g1~~TRINITY_DN10810_c0_g1_i1.p1  ORF type:complete len:298 (+),score=50.71 TRINITY_DN10810_c0_g1_i1:73-966(+)
MCIRDRESTAAPIAQAKLKTRPCVTDWAALNLAKHPELCIGCSDPNPRVDCRHVPRTEFHRIFQASLHPAMLTGLAEDWNCLRGSWSVPRLLERFGSQLFRVGSDSNGDAVKMRLTDFVAYCQDDAGAEDAPLYLFEGQYGEHPVLCGLLEDYEPPGYFAEGQHGQRCLFEHLAAWKKPPHRWLLLGPQRSGSVLHRDPLSTSAWNLLIEGRKHWVLFPPSTPSGLVEGLYADKASAAAWFCDHLPIVRSSEAWSEHRPLEFVQQPGEMMYVPAGWHHAVLNIDLSLIHISEPTRPY